MKMEKKTRRRLYVTAVSHEGGRPQDQEDCILIDKYSNSQNHPQYSYKGVFRGESRVKVFAVCDGMGGHDSGAEASEMVAEHIQIALTEKYTSIDEISGVDILRCIDQVREKFNRMENVAGTTLSLVMMEPDLKRCKAFNVGDSPIYLYRGGRLKPCYDGMRRSGSSNVLTAAIGKNMPIKLYETEIELCSTDKLLICSDGVESIAKGKLESILRRKRPAQRLLSEALIQNVDDNVSTVVIEFK